MFLTKQVQNTNILQFKQTIKFVSILLGVMLFVFIAGCDTDISGETFDNIAPNTSLSVRDTSLVDNLEGGADRFSSTVFVSWSGEDPDGIVKSYEIRFYDLLVSPNEEWTSTTALDTLILLPIIAGESAADVVFEVRAIDNDGAVDPTPAKTVFPIINAPPTVKLSQFDLPPDTSFTVVTFTWTADDPEGEDNLKQIEVSLNDSTSFVALPADFNFITLVAENVDNEDDGQTETTAKVYSGLSFVETQFVLPNLKLDAENTFYIRAVDLTDTTSILARHTWHVTKPKSDVLYVNDYRKSSSPVVQDYHLAILDDYLPAGVTPDVWDISRPSAAGSSGFITRSTALPTTQDPTLRETLALYKYVYWVTTNSTNNSTSNNLPYTAAVTDVFFENGGKMMVHSPASRPADPSENIGNQAIALLPMSQLVTFPDSLRTSFRLKRDSLVESNNNLPNVTEQLPNLKATGFYTNTLPYEIGTSMISLYEAHYTYITREGNRQGLWTGTSTVASISDDGRIALFALPLVKDTDGSSFYIGEDDDTEAPKNAIHLMLESLGFPKN